MNIDRKHAIIEAAVNWCNRKGCEAVPFNIIAALDVLGLLRDERETMNEGYQPKPSGIPHDQLKPPRGGSAIDPPGNGIWENYYKQMGAGWKPIVTQTKYLYRFEATSGGQSANQTYGFQTLAEMLSYLMQCEANNKEACEHWRWMWNVHVAGTPRNPECPDGATWDEISAPDTLDSPTIREASE